MVGAKSSASCGGDERSQYLKKMSELEDERRP